MPVQSNDSTNSARWAQNGGSPPLPGGQAGWESRGGLGDDAVALQGRESVVKARLSILLAVLGEFPSQFTTEPPPPGTGLAHLIDDMCPTGTLVVHDKKLAPCALPLEHLVVAPRGLVVVSPEWIPVPVKGPERAEPTRRPGATATEASGLDDGQRSRLVREALRRANALRAWLDQTPWTGTPVWAAVCLEPVVGPPPAPPVALDGLWVGDVERLPAWLACRSDLDGPDRAALGYFLAAELPAS